jgi:hypothetical protein
MSWKTLVGAGAIGALVIVGSPAAQADTSTPAPTPSSTATNKAGQARLHVRAVRLCRRASRVEPRVNRLVTRLSAGPGTRGSIQFLQARANRVRAKDAALADILDGRVAIRQSRLHTLQLRRQQLPKVTAWCATHDLKSGG